jgi:hypothetical protein
MTLVYPITWLDLVRQVAADYRLILTDDMAYMILWEYTGYPSFWRVEPLAECEAQLREFFDASVPWPKA